MKERSDSQQENQKSEKSTRNVRKKNIFHQKKRDRCRSYYLIGMVSFIDRIKYCVFSLFRFVVVVVDSNGINGMQATIFFAMRSPTSKIRVQLTHECVHKCFR